MYNFYRFKGRSSRSGKNELLFPDSLAGMLAVAERGVPSNRPPLPMRKTPESPQKINTGEQKTRNIGYHTT